MVKLGMEEDTVVSRLSHASCGATAGMGRLCYVSGHLGSFCTSHELTRVIVTVRAKLRVSM